MENQPPAVPPLPSTPPLIPHTPPLSPLPAPRKRRSGTIWKVLGVLGLIVVLLGVAGFKMIVRFADAVSGSARLDERALEEVVVENNHSKNKIAVVDVQGIITDQMDQFTGMGMVRFIKDQFKLIEDDPAVKAVLLKVDSPGGEVLASDDIYRIIANFQKESKKPVIASMGGLAASGGYYVSAPCQWIVANELTITGSIGVIMHGYNYRGLMNKIGVRPEVFKSGKFKDMLSGDKEQEEITAEERAMVQSLIDETFGKFQSVVAEGRKNATKKNSGQGRELAKNWKDYADGRILSGKQAYDLGFVDELVDFDAAVERTLAIADIEDANLVEYRLPMTFASLFRIFGKTEAPKIQVDLGMDHPKIQAGRLYFISSSLLH
ncbi:MAG: signal peptide peptidase SppA [Verrucomicrobia bacterium]|nr:signal peptide peptidase SppA [Verrucomicrobiota bacterium]